jgi:hypothetical protein
VVFTAAAFKGAKRLLGDLFDQATNPPTGTSPCHPGLRSRYPYNRCQRREAVHVERLAGRPFLEVHMKAILSAAVVLGLCGLAGARDAKADPVGKWKCAYEIGGQQRMATLTITKDGDKLAGTMSWPDQKETKLKDVKLKDGALTFSVERKVMDNQLTVEYNLKINGDKFQGKAAVEVGGEKREIDIEGKREKKDK